VYVKAIAERCVANGIFAWFQNDAFASAEVAIPKSPIPPARASGDIRNMGTAVVTTLMDWVCWASAGKDKQVNKPNNKAEFFLIRVII
jgi:hypothetical protein